MSEARTGGPVESRRLLVQISRPHPVVGGAGPPYLPQAVRWTLSATAAAVAETPGPRHGALIRWSWILLGTLLLQNVLGMGLNLYVALPSPVTFTYLFVTTPLLTAHIVLGFLLVIMAALLLVRVRTVPIVGRTRSAALVLVFVVVALQEGFAFVFTGDNAFSYGMEVGFVLAVAFQASVLFRVARARPRLSSGVRSPDGPAVAR